MKTSQQKLDYQKAYRLLNADKVKEYNKVYMKQYREANRGKMRLYCAKWREQKLNQNLIYKEAVDLIKTIHSLGLIDHEGLPTLKAFVDKLESLED
jgi:hypothetical protein